MRAGLAIWLEIGNPRHHSHKQGNTGERAKGSGKCPSETAGEKTSPCDVQKREALQPKVRRCLRCVANGACIYTPAPSCHCTLCAATTSHLDNKQLLFFAWWLAAKGLRSQGSKDSTAFRALAWTSLGCSLGKGPISNRLNRGPLCPWHAVQPTTRA